ncbi:hypothetical protein MMC10_006719 [Thelotrema lepadinum]|nr:hypothetical protein [Thelotrema lepadinum]
MEEASVTPKTLPGVQPEQNFGKETRFMPICACYEKSHQLVDLNTLQIGDRLLVMALKKMSEIRRDYAQYKEVDYKNAFNWDGVFAELKSLAEKAKYSWPQSRQYHIIAFYSQLDQTIGSPEAPKLADLDEAAFDEAIEIGGLLKYWFGIPDDKGRNLATCEHCAELIPIKMLMPVGIWRSKEEANAVRGKTSHMKAKTEGFQMYHNILIQELELTVEAGLVNLEVGCKKEMHVKNGSQPGTFGSGRATNSLS